MYNHTNVKQMYVSLRDNAAASTSTTVKSPSDLRLGEIALVATGSLTFNVAGTYSFTASIPADAQYQAETTTPQQFVVALQNRTLTVTVVSS